MTVYINFCLNIEAGAERALHHGDDEFEDYLPPIPIMNSQKGQRHYFIEEWFEYGMKVGLPSLLGLFEANQIPISLFLCGRSIEVFDDSIIQSIQSSSHEIVGHAYRWIDYQTVPLDEEKSHINHTLSLIQNKLNKPCLGWYTGRRSKHTIPLVAELGLRYSSDFYGDLDIEKRVYHGRTLYMIPYSLYTNDINLLPVLGGQSDEDFLLRLKHQIDYLAQLNRDHLCTIGLHERISGVPGRLQILKTFIDYAKKAHCVFITRNDYLDHYLIALQKKT